MRIARKLFLLATMALAALALTATTAAAQDFEVIDEVTEEHCAAVTIDVHHVEGGCHVVFEGIDIPLFAYIPAKTQISTCEVNLEARIDEAGEGYVTAATFSPPDRSADLCSRAPCDEDTGAGDTMVPWPLHLREEGPGEEEVAAEFCLRTIASGEGGARTWCDIDLEFTDLGNHVYEAGHLDAPNNASEVFCRNSPGMGYTGPHPVLSAPVSIEPHFLSHTDVEVIHNQP